MSYFNRRSMLGFSLGGAGAALAGLPGLAARAATGIPYTGGPDKWIIDDTSAVADTESGKVMGYVRNGVRIFKGIPYAEVLSPQDRWKRGAKVRLWAGKRSARAPGLVCPPDTAPPENESAARQSHDEALLRDSDYQLTRPGEDCLRVNIWTPGVDHRKRPVMFYLHGGGFHNGSALMATRYEAHNLARYGDVVVVNVTHRLNAFGHLDLTAYGTRFADTANLGMLDVVDALKWVKNNIVNFGGDPGNVMIFGQSGGGAKVLTLLAMPEAKGLFHRAASHSAGPLPLLNPDESAKLTEQFLKLVNVSPSNIDGLYKLPVETLTSAAGILWADYQETRNRYERWNVPATDFGWRAVVDGRTVLYHPSSPTTPSDVPLVIGTTLHETFGALDHPEYAGMNEVQGRDILRAFFGPAGDGIYDVYKGAFPEAIPYEISAMARAMGHFRAHSVKAAQARAAIHSAPTYSYSFRWRANTFEGRAMSHHELDMPMVFMNSNEIPNLTGATAQARAMSLKMADTWLAFARTGNPNNNGLPNWRPVTPSAVPAMVFDNSCSIDHGSDLAAIEMFWKERFAKT